MIFNTFFLNFISIKAIKLCRVMKFPLLTMTSGRVIRKLHET